MIGVDLSPGMVAEARRELAADLAARVRFEAVDSAALLFPTGSFDLAVLLNMIRFFDELARVVSPGGRVLVAFSNGPTTRSTCPRSAFGASSSGEVSRILRIFQRARALL